MHLWGIEVKKETSRHTIDGKGANVWEKVVSISKEVIINCENAIMLWKGSRWHDKKNLFLLLTRTWLAWPRRATLLIEEENISNYSIVMIQALSTGLVSSYGNSTSCGLLFVLLLHFYRYLGRTWSLPHWNFHTCLPPSPLSSHVDFGFCMQLFYLRVILAIEMRLTQSTHSTHSTHQNHIEHYF